jgi:hypothetical protein
MHHKRSLKRAARTALLSTTSAPVTQASSPISPNDVGQSARIDPLLTDFDLEELTGRARSSWQKARLTGGGPPFIRLGRLVRYRHSDFEAWLAAHSSLRSTSEAA